MRFPYIDDFHVHLREPDKDNPDNVDMMVLSIRALIPYCRRVMAMLNTKHLVVNSLEKLDFYADRVERACELAGAPKDFEVYLCPKIYQDYDTPTSPEFIAQAAKWRGCGKHVRCVLAFKAYPAGQTTNSEGGITDFTNTHFLESMRALQESKLALSIHSEYPCENRLLRETLFFADVAPVLVEHVGSLRVVLEHVSTAKGAHFVFNNKAFFTTITPHHLTFTTADVLNEDGSIRDPHKNCAPICQSADDIAALKRYIAHPRFFYGSDSAPHPLEAKQGSNPACGVFSAPLAPDILAELLNTLDHDSVVSFYARRGATFYGLPDHSGKRGLELKEFADGEFSLPPSVSFGSATVGLPQHFSKVSLVQKGN